MHAHSLSYMYVLSRTHAHTHTHTHTRTHTVRAIEQNKAVGSEQKIEDVLESVARQVQQRQIQRDTKPDKAAHGSSRAEKPTIDLSGRDLSRSFSMASRTTPTTVGSGADPKKGLKFYALVSSMILSIHLGVWYIHAMRSL